MTDVPTGLAMTALMGAGDEEWEAFNGATFPALYALMARRHMLEYGTAITDINGLGEEPRQRQTQRIRPIPVRCNTRRRAKLIASRRAVAPAALLSDNGWRSGSDISQRKKGQRNMRQSSMDNRIVHGKPRNAALAIEKASRRQSLRSSRQKTHTNKQAGITAKDIDFAEVHDCFAIAEILAIEALGFCKIGAGGKYTEDGHTKIGGERPVNTSGGLKGKGHPVGTTGIAQAIEATLQLRGTAGKRQVKDAEIGLTHNVGGSAQLRWFTFTGGTKMKRIGFILAFDSSERYNLIGTECGPLRRKIFPAKEDMPQLQETWRDRKELQVQRQRRSILIHSNTRGAYSWLRVPRNHMHSDS